MLIGQADLLSGLESDQITLLPVDDSEVYCMRGWMESRGCYPRHLKVRRAGSGKWQACLTTLQKQ